MPARNRRLHQNDTTRTKIKAGMITKKLQDHVFGTEDMTASQIKAAEILLRKIMPDLKQIEVSGDPDNPLEHNHNIAIEFV